MDMVRGRAISRDSQQDNKIGSDLAAIFFRLSQIASDEVSYNIKSMVRSWTEENDRLDFEGLTLGDITNLKTLRTDSSVKLKSGLVLHKQYPVIYRVIHRCQVFPL